MKTLHSALIAAALAVGVTPAALAESTDAPVDAQAFARGGLTPIAHEQPQYPARSIAEREEGVCTVKFDIAADGKVANPELKNCSSWDFEREALRVVSSLEYPARPGGAVIEDQEITFRWAGQE
jgi:TonB family protein